MWKKPKFYRKIMDWGKIHYYYQRKEGLGGVKGKGSQKYGDKR